MIGARTSWFNWQDVLDAVRQLSLKVAGLELGHPLYKSVSDLEDLIQKTAKIEESK